METGSLVIKNGLIVNGKNEPAFPGTLVIRDGRVAQIIRSSREGSGIAGGCLGDGDVCGNDLIGGWANESGIADGFAAGAGVIDARGAYVTPGFVDIHRHGDWKAFLGADGGDDELLNRQGITTVVNGNCGLSVAPTAAPRGTSAKGTAGGAGREAAESSFAAEIRHYLRPVVGSKPDIPSAVDADRDFSSYFAALSQVPRTVNTGMLAGNGTIRASVAGYRAGKLTPSEVRAVRRSVEQALADGALGISLGLGYAPEFEYDADGLIEVLEPLRGSGIPLVTHIRSEGDGSFASIEEVIQVAEALEIPLHISHMKCIGRRSWGAGAERTLSLLHRKNGEGMRIDYDLYPYRTGSTQLLHVIPPAFQKGGIDAFIAGLAEPSFRAALTRALQTPSSEFENIVELVGFENIAAGTMRSAAFQSYSGWTIDRIAEAVGGGPYETLYNILAAENCEVTMLDTIACEDDLRAFYGDPLSSVISDAIYPDGGRLHPRVYAAFPEFLIRYVRESGFLSLEEAIFKMTANPARVLGIDRGVIEEGAAADLCVFDLRELRAPANFEEPAQLCSGFRYVIVGGKIVVEQDAWRPASAGAGQVIRRQ